MECNSERSAFVEPFFQIYNGLTEIEKGFARLSSLLIEKVNDARLVNDEKGPFALFVGCLLYTSPSPRDPT